MRYEWNGKKRLLNLAHHRVDFEAINYFDWETADVVRDQRRDYGEERFVGTGVIENRVHIAVFTIRAGRVRLISLRKANRREVLAYMGAKDD
ncbi:MAG: BrnT family toxin [Pseudomonadota bacterium]